MSEKRELTMREIGKIGGDKRRSQLSREEYAEMGRAGGKVTAERHGSEHYARIGQKGGSTCAMRNGFGHYSRIGREGGKKMKRLVELGKELEADNGETAGATRDGNLVR